VNIHLGPTEDSQEDIISTPETSYSRERAGPSTHEVSQKRKTRRGCRILEGTEVIKRRQLQI
jgi:hypothetical protein